MPLSQDSSEGRTPGHALVQVLAKRLRSHLRRAAAFVRKFVQELGSLTSAGKAFPQQFRSIKRHPTVNINWGKQTRAGETWRSVPAPRVLGLSALASSYGAEERPQLSGSGFASQLAMLVASEEECSRHVPHCHIPPTLLPRPSPQRLSSAGCASQHHCM